MIRFRSALLILFSLLFVASCSAPKEPALNLDDVEWKIYRNRIIGFEFKFPSTFTYDVKDMGHNVFLKHKNVNTVLVRYSTEEEGKKRGLWFGYNAAEKVNTNGHEWSKYIYLHANGPLKTLTTAYVTPLNDRFFRN